MWQRAACVMLALLTVFLVIVGHGMIDANGGGYLWEFMLFCGGVSAALCFAWTYGEGI